MGGISFLQGLTVLEEEDGPEPFFLDAVLGFFAEFEAAEVFKDDF